MRRNVPRLAKSISVMFSANWTTKYRNSITRPPVRNTPSLCKPSRIGKWRHLLLLLRIVSCKFLLTIVVGTHILTSAQCHRSPRQLRWPSYRRDFDCNRYAGDNDRRRSGATKRRSVKCDQVCPYRHITLRFLIFFGSMHHGLNKAAVPKNWQTSDRTKYKLVTTQFMEYLQGCYSTYYQFRLFDAYS